MLPPRSPLASFYIRGVSFRGWCSFCLCYYQLVDLSDGHNGTISSAALTPSCRLSEGTLALNLGNDPCRPQVFSL